MVATGVGGGSGDGESKAYPMIGANLLNKFLKLQFLKCRGTANPFDLQECMRELDKIFKLTWPEEYLVGFATHLLTTKVDHWRDYVTPSDEEEGNKPINLVKA